MWPYGDWTILDHDAVRGIPSRRWAEPWKQKEREKEAVREKETEENKERGWNRSGAKKGERKRARKGERAARREIGGKTNEPRNKRAPAHERTQREGLATRRWGGGTAPKGDQRGGLCTRGRGEHGIKQPRHRIVKGKVLLLRPPTDSRLIGFKDELFGYLQKHVLKRTTTLASLYYLLRARAAKGDGPEFTGQSSLISFRCSQVSYCDCIGLLNLVSPWRKDFSID